MAPSIYIAARRVDGVRLVPRQRQGDGALSSRRARPLDGTFAARRGVRTGREDSLHRGNTSSATRTPYEKRDDHPVFQTETSAL